jgi:DNA-binding MarR family transcriptional regulator
MIDRKQRVSETLVRVLNKYVENQKKPRKYGLEERLYPAEIHMIMLIGDNKGSGVMDLSEKAGITKGAVSQMLKRLENKDLIEKGGDPDNSKKIVLKLTNRGNVAYYYHKKLHEEMDGELYAFLDSLSQMKLKALEDFFMLFEKGIDKRSET